MSPPLHPQSHSPLLRGTDSQLQSGRLGTSGRGAGDFGLGRS